MIAPFPQNLWSSPDNVTLRNTWGILSQWFLCFNAGWSEMSQKLKTQSWFYSSRKSTAFTLNMANHIMTKGIQLIRCHLPKSSWRKWSTYSCNSKTASNLIKEFVQEIRYSMLRICNIRLSVAKHGQTILVQLSNYVLCR